MTVIVGYLVVGVIGEIEHIPIGKHNQQPNDIERPHQHRLEHVPIDSEGNIGIEQNLINQVCATARNSCTNDITSYLVISMRELWQVLNRVHLVLHQVSRVSPCLDKLLDCFR